MVNLQPLRCVGVGVPVVAADQPQNEPNQTNETYNLKPSDSKCHPLQEYLTDTKQDSP